MTIAQFSPQISATSQSGLANDRRQSLYEVVLLFVSAKPVRNYPLSADTSRSLKQICNARFGHEEEYQRPHDASPDEQHPEAPSPVRKLIDKSANHWTDLGTNKRRCSIDDHRRTKFVLCEHITYGTACHAEKGTAGQAIEEANDEHSLNVLSYGARDKPNKVHAERAQVDDPSAIELRERRQEHGPESQAAHERSQTYGSDLPAHAKLGLELLVGAGVKRTGTRHAERREGYDDHDQPFSGCGFVLGVHRIVLVEFDFELLLGIVSIRCEFVVTVGSRCFVFIAGEVCIAVGV